MKWLAVGYLDSHEGINTLSQSFTRLRATRPSHVSETRSGDNTAGSTFSFAHPLRRHLEIPLLTKLRALCLHSRLISPLIPPTRSFHVRSPIAQDTNQINMNWSTSVYTTLSSDTEPSIVITFDSAKYIFNAGENTTRAILQNARGWRKVKALFLTRLGTQRSSGVPGV
jgi:hypothetical protein